VAINHTNNWGVLYADKAKLLQFGEINRHVPEGIGSTDTSENGGSFNDRENFPGLCQCQPFTFPIYIGV
jgi:hypothetical protein